MGPLEKEIDSLFEKTAPCGRRRLFPFAWERRQTNVAAARLERYFTKSDHSYFSLLPFGTRRLAAHSIYQD